MPEVAHEMLEWHDFPLFPLPHMMKHGSSCASAVDALTARTSTPPPPLSFPTPCCSPGGGWGTVTWPTQKFSLRLIVLLCG